jgi:hypothetical protein
LLISQKSISVKKLLLVLLVIVNFIRCDGEPKIDAKPNLNKEQVNDSILKRQLEQIAIEDQTLRFLLPETIERFGRESKEYKYVWSLIDRQDSISIHKLTKIIDKYGWLGKNRVGDEANQAIWLVLQHSKLEVQEKYLPLLRKSVAKGESEGWHLAFLEDRVLMYNEKKQKFGTQAIWDDKLKRNKIYPIENVENVNKRRKALGLEPIEAYAKSNGHLFDPKD